MKISLLINMKMPTIVGIFIFISREISCSAELSMKNVLNRGTCRILYYTEPFEPRHILTAKIQISLRIECPQTVTVDTTECINGE